MKFKKSLPIHPEIPHGPYCYDEKTCPHWECVESDEQGRVVRARCNFLNEEDEYPQDLKLLWDKVKLCNVHDLDFDS